MFQISLVLKNKKNKSRQVESKWRSCVYVNLFLNRCTSPSCSIRKSLAYFAPDFDQICSFILRRRFQQQGFSFSRKGSCTQRRVLPFLRHTNTAQHRSQIRSPQSASAFSIFHRTTQLPVRMKSCIADWTPSTSCSNLFCFSFNWQKRLKKKKSLQSNAKQWITLREILPSYYPNTTTALSTRQYAQALCFSVYFKGI